MSIEAKGVKDLDGGSRPFGISFGRSEEVGRIVHRERKGSILCNYLHLKALLEFYHCGMYWWRPSVIQLYIYIAGTG